MPVGECLFLKQGLLLIIYVDDVCIISPSTAQIKQEIISLQKDYDLTDDGKLQKLFGDSIRETD